LLGKGTLPRLTNEANMRDPTRPERMRSAPAHAGCRMTHAAIARAVGATVTTAALAPEHS
jgi:hypothetical protein